MFAFHYDIPVDDFTALAVNYIDLGDKTVNSFIFYHTYKVTYKTEKSEKKNTIICVCSVAYKPISRTDIPHPTTQPAPFCEFIRNLECQISGGGTFFQSQK